jgi:hypothetical protein
MSKAVDSEGNQAADSLRDALRVSQLTLMKI